MERKVQTDLAVVKQYLQHGTYPKGYVKHAKGAVRQRSKSFLFAGGQLFFTGGRRCESIQDESEDKATKNIEHQKPPNRICCITEEEQDAAVLRCHIGEDGTHYGRDKTADFVQSKYYWVGIMKTVHNFIRNCQFCVRRNTISQDPKVPLGAMLVPGSSANFSDDENEDCSPVVYVDLASPATGIGIKMECETMCDTQILSTPVHVEPDIFFVSHDNVAHFWQKVEVQVFGPYPVAKKMMYVALAVDCYSQFPEATVLESLSAQTVTAFVFNLICRYGVMEKLCLLQNSVTAHTLLHISAHELEVAGIAPKCEMMTANPTDERWQRISTLLDQFVKRYPQNWDKCLETFMVPLRISLPPHADYAPFYLMFNREPMLPEKISHRSENICNTEIRLTEENEKETIDVLMTAYSRLSKSAPAQHPVISVDMHPVVKIEPLPEVLNLEQSTIVPLTFESQEPEVKNKRGRPRKKPLEPQIEVPNDDSMGWESAVSDDDGDAELPENDELDDDVDDETYDPRKKHQDVMVTRSSSRKRKLTYKAQVELETKKERVPASASYLEEIDEDLADITFEPRVPSPVKRLRGGSRKVKRDLDDSMDLDDSVKKENATRGITDDGLINSLELLSIDLYYLVLRQYKEHATYPPLFSDDAKRSVRRLARTVEIKDGKMYGVSGKAKGKRIIIKERERFCLMRKAHVRGEYHKGRDEAFKILMEQQKVYWKGVSRDIAAFGFSCPECICVNPHRNKTRVRIPSASKVLSKKDLDATNFHLSEDEEEAASYEDIIQYLTDGTFPATATDEQQSCISKRSQVFCIIDGSLFYTPPAKQKTTPRKVLFSTRSREDAIKEAHIEDGRHLSQQDTQAILRKKYFWSGMTYDVLMYVSSCSCMAKSMKALPEVHNHPSVWHKVENFRSYYKDGIKDVLLVTEQLGISEPSAGVHKEISSNGCEVSNMSAQSHPDADSTFATHNVDGAEVCGPADDSPRTTKEVQIIAQAVENAIVELGGKKHEPVKKPKRLKASGQKQHGDSTERVRKAISRHRCDHCGVMVRGDTAFKVHLYKHTGIKPFSCSVCPKSFTNRKSQRIHMMKHTGIRPHLCCYCGRSFYRSATLRQHLKVHTKGEPVILSCDICGRTFTSGHRLNRHKTFKHPAQKPVYMCNQCGRHFSHARSLKRHEQTHQDIKNYQCEFCSKSFFRKEYLTGHLSSHPEADIEAEKRKPRRKPGPKPRLRVTETGNSSRTETKIMLPGPSGDAVPSNIIHWSKNDQTVLHHLVTDISALCSQSTQALTVQPANAPLVAVSSSGAISSASRFVQDLSSGMAAAHQHNTVHSIQHSHAGRPFTVTVSAQGQPLEVVHGTGSEILLQPNLGPVRYEIECDSNFAEAINLLAQGQLHGN